MEVFIHDNLGKKEGNEGLLKVTVPEKVDKALDQAFKK